MNPMNPTTPAPAPAKVEAYWLPRIRWVSYRASLTDTRNLGECRYYDADLVPLPGPLNMLGSKGPVLEFWHGFNSTFDDVRSAYYSQLASLFLAGFLDRAGIEEIHFCLWPGGERGALSWPFANNRALRTAEAHAATLAQTQDKPSAIAHSLGNLIVCRAGRVLRRVAYTNWISLNAAIDNDVLAPGRQYDLAKRCKRALIFYSKNDPVLRNLYTLSGLTDLDGKGLDDLALGLTGPKGGLDAAADICSIDCTGVIDSHGGVRFSLPAAGLMTKQLSGGVFPSGNLKDVALSALT